MGRRLMKKMLIVLSLSIAVFGIAAILAVSGCSVDMMDYIKDKIAQDEFKDYNFNMSYCQGGTFPTGIDDSGTDTVEPFWIAQTEVPYLLWSDVYNWATSNGYTFANSGRMGGWGAESDHTVLHPVTEINWRDTMVWMNAFTEFYNEKYGKSLVPVYYTDPGYTNLQKISTDSTTTTEGTPGSQDAPYVRADADGFRLPTQPEWECAARWKGNDSSNGAIESPTSSGFYWTPGDYASGATADYTDAEATKLAAWYGYVDSDGVGTNVVGQKPASGNALGLYDMSGNVGEWSYTLASGAFRRISGGDYANTADIMQIGFLQQGYPYYMENTLGFRPVRSP